ncbi:hypothetical protein [Laceyella putida]|uniref:Uncharacterized protein n=1 Tax=Laceyella putida TaxID=110101 RepID=A0ABW2RMG0_9BACL
MKQQPVRPIPLSSSLPEQCCAIFPAISGQRGELEKSRVLLNPSVDVLQSLPEQSDRIIAYDMLPSQEALPLLRGRTVWVPSFAFRYHCQQHQVKTEVRYPVPRAVIQLVRRKKEAKQHLSAAQQLLLWVDECLIPQSEKTSLLDTLQQTCRMSPRLKVVWVTEQKEARHKHIWLIPRDEVERNELWYGADLLLTVGPTDQSFVPLHVQCLHTGIVVLTDGAGDHDEWIRHQFSGVVLNPKTLNKELRSYLLMMADNPTWLLGLKRNGQSLLRRIRGMGEAIESE